MKKVFSKLILSLFLLLFINNLQAQDAMILRAKPDTLWVKIIEIGTDEIRYKLWPVDEEMPIMVENKDRIRKVILSNGTVLRFSENEFVNAENYANQKKAIIKMDLFSILVGSTSLSYEKSIEPGRSYEVGIGLIGMGAKPSDNGFNDSYKRSGTFLRVGYKFINQPDYYMKGMRYTHILKGAYIRPEIVANLYNLKTIKTYYNYNTLSPFDHEDITRYSAVSFMLNFGKQWVFSDIFAVDFFIGGGLGGGKTTSVDVGQNIGSGSGFYNYDYYGSSAPAAGVGFGTRYNSGIGFTGQIGLKIGVLIGSNTSNNK
ncbi:MAG: hypothetical protein K9I36_02215 [Bacteroidia bacterium]|nr:hypothetical protein [Bacteroidia bacterium]MCF8425518.1 hypothetical protein [Bacteroidia bacterium]